MPSSFRKPTVRLALQFVNQVSEVCRYLGAWGHTACCDELRTELQEDSDNSSDHHAVPGLGTQGEDTGRV